MVEEREAAVTEVGGPKDPGKKGGPGANATLPALSFLCSHSQGRPPEG